MPKMPQFRWRGGELCQQIKGWFTKKLSLIKLTHKSLFYNKFTTCTVIMDTIPEPMFWFVDHFVRYLGPAFVVIVICLTLSVTVIFYICLLPHQYEQSLTWTILHFVVGHYFLVCIVYNYFKASFTDPGSPPEKVEEVVSICKRCIGPKPPRTHHCSVCKKCILKMDHHCPWLNNCVGQHNQRYFFLFCTYMWIATVYVSAVAYPMFKEHFYGDSDPGPSGMIYPFYLAKKSWESKPQPPNDNPVHHSDEEIQLEKSAKLLRRNSVTGLPLHSLIIYEFMLCSAVSVALGVLVLWQCRLISYAETSIEWHINKRERKRAKKMGQVYKNPYDFGPRNNWLKFLGISDKRSFVTHVLLPSSHPPEEDGLRWKTSTYVLDNQILLL